MVFVIDEWVKNILMFFYGVYLFFVEDISEEEILCVIIGFGLVDEGDMVFLMKGMFIGKIVGTNTIRIFNV